MSTRSTSTSSWWCATCAASPCPNSPTNTPSAATHRRLREALAALRRGALPRHRQGARRRPLEAGHADARRFCREHGLAEADTALVVWLVEHHLSMSNVAQKQDLADPEVVRAFAGLVGDEAADRPLSAHRRRHPRHQSEGMERLEGQAAGRPLQRRPAPAARRHAPAGLGIAERQEDARRLLRYFGLRQGVEGAFWKELDTVYFLRHDAEEIAWHTRASTTGRRRSSRW
jgi:hypothetical protein